MVLSPYSFGAYVTPPSTDFPHGAPGEVLRARRITLNLRQEDLANEADVSQKLISEIERGEQELTAAGLGRVVKIARALNWTLNELQEHTGLDLGIEAPEFPRKGGPPIPPRLAPVEVPLEIPQGLQEAIDRYSGIHPEFTVEQNLRAITSIYRYGGGADFTPEEWLDIMAANRRWLVKP